MSKIFFFELTDLDDNKIFVNIANIDVMQYIQSIQHGDITKLNIGNDALCVKESIDFIKEKLHIINEHI